MYFDYQAIKSIGHIKNKPNRNGCKWEVEVEVGIIQFFFSTDSLLLTTRLIIIARIFKKVFKEASSRGSSKETTYIPF